MRRLVAGIRADDGADRSGAVNPTGIPLSASNPHRPEVAPVPRGAIRPLWSVMIPAYNAADTLAQTLASVLAQDPGPTAMEIEVVDDASTQGDCGAMVARLGRGRVAFHRQARNLGATGNFTDCIRRARGHLVHLLHADDLVEPGFYARMQRAFEANPRVGAAFCRHFFIDAAGRELSLSPLERRESGILDQAPRRLAEEQRIMAPSIVVRRDVYEKLGGFDDRLVCAEDWEMWVRIAARYPVWYETEPLARYRMHDNSNTGRHLRSGEDMHYTAMAIALFLEHLPRDLAASVGPKARRTYALSALRSARLLLQRRDWIGAAAQIREALRLSQRPAVLAKAGRLLLSGGASMLARRSQPSASS